MIDRMARLEPRDLEYLIFNKVALRFQYAEHNEGLLRTGSVTGDAYSLSAPRFWHPATEEKTEIFTQGLNTLLGKIFQSQMASRDRYDGSFLLFRNIEGARLPVEGRSYGPPFLPVGAGTKFDAKNIIGRVDITRLRVTGDLGFTQARDTGAADKVIRFLAGGLTDAIRDARIDQPANTVDIKADAEKIEHERTVMEIVSRRRVAAGLPPGPPSRL